MGDDVQQAQLKRIIKNLRTKYGTDLVKAIVNGSEQARRELRSMFDSYEELKNAPPVKFLINKFLQAYGLTLIAGLSGHNKSWLMMYMVKCLLTGEQMFDRFDVETVDKVVYAVPELTRAQAYLRFALKFGLDEYLKNGRLLISTLNIGRKISLAEPELLELCNKSKPVIFLDTLPRFREDGRDESSADGNKQMADQIFNLLAQGALAVIAAQHSPKGFETEWVMTKENVVRGSGDIIAMASTIWGIRQLTAADDGTANIAYIQNVKPRDFDPIPAFTVRLRPCIDERGVIEMVAEPGECGTMKEEINHFREYESPLDRKKAFAYELWLSNKDMGRPTLNDAIKKEFGGGVNTTTLAGWLSEWNNPSDAAPTKDQFEKEER